MEGCIHHWMIEPARERRPSKGVCLHCKEERLFQNYMVIEDYAWANLAGERVSPFNAGKNATKAG